MSTTHPETPRNVAAGGLTGLELTLAWIAVILLLAAIAFVIGATIAS
jgi:hypothetical protein